MKTLTPSSSSTPQLDAAPKAEASTKQRMELQREVEALSVSLEKQVGTASVGERQCDVQRESRRWIDKAVCRNFLGLFKSKTLCQHANFQSFCFCV